MRTVKFISILTVALPCLIIQVAQAKTPFDITSCTIGPAKVFSPNKGLIIISVELRSIMTSNHKNKIFDNFTFHFVGVSRIKAGQVDARGYAKWTDLDGDLIFSESTATGKLGKLTWKWTFIYGTGKWKGIKGSAIVTPITKRRPISNGIWHGCNRAIGTFELPK